MVRKSLNSYIPKDKELSVIYLFSVLFCYIAIFINLYGNDYINRSVNVVFRTFIVFLSIIVIYQNRQNFIKRKSAVIPFIIFFSILIGKHFITYYCYGYHSSVASQALAELLYFGFVVIPLPVIALILIDYGTINFEKLFAYALEFMAFIVSLSFFANFIVGFPSGSLVFRSYYILYGHYAATCIVLCYLDIVIYKKYPPYILVSIIIMALLLLYCSASRSAFVSLLCQLGLITAIFHKKKLIIWLTVTLVILALAIVGHRHFPNVAFLKRVSDMLLHADGSGRSYYLQKGWREFKSSPIIGGRAKFFNDTYPHNIFIDILMSTGLLGLLISLFYYKFVAKGFIFILTVARKIPKYFFLAAIWLQYFLLDQTSSTALLNYESWFFGATLTGIYFTIKNEKTKSNDRRGNAARNHKALAGFSCAGRL